MRFKLVLRVYNLDKNTSVHIKFVGSSTTFPVVHSSTISYVCVCECLNSLQMASLQNVNIKLQNYFINGHTQTYIHIHTNN